VGASELLAYPYWCIEKGYAQYTGPNDPSESWSDRARGWIRVMHLDAWLSMLIYLTATIAFFILGAAILHEETGGGGLPDSVAGMLKVLSAMYRPVLGQRVATWFIVIGAFAVLYSTLFAATAGNSRLIADFSRLQGWIPRDSPKDFRNVVRLGCCILPTLGFVLYLAVQNPVLMVTIGGVMQALSLPPIAAAAVFLRYRRTDRRLLPGRAWDLFLWASLAGLCAAAVVTGWLELRKLLGWP
jgi:amino acid transporter